MYNYFVDMTNLYHVLVLVHISEVIVSARQFTKEIKLLI